jgi:hypothetical protein
LRDLRAIVCATIQNDRRDEPQRHDPTHRPNENKLSYG